MRRVFVIFAALTLLAAGTLPACLAGFCCAMPAEASIHANMPCCADDEAMAPRESKPAPAVTFAVVAPVQPTTPVIATAVAHVPTIVTTDDEIRREPAPSPYLLNAQFRI